MDIERKSLNIDDLQEQLNILQAKNLSFDKQMKSIDVIFKEGVLNRLSIHMKAYKTHWNEIKSKYNTITPEILEKECAEVLTNKFAKANATTSPSYRMAPDCGWRYYVCGAAATSGAILCHGGCDTTALATTASLGIPACVALCGTLQVYAMVQCHDAYCV